MDNQQIETFNAGYGPRYRVTNDPGSLLDRTEFTTEAKAEARLQHLRTAAATRPDRSTQ
ncbi:hypothetical protein [Streptomyces sp. t39]|uniref:hypothetical protein n=1 Tax=Streptomyces sp. t39 TaxID=1828156 RepID=UPI00164EFFE0|nr:hypothetical protein [Streptomyces sp. t39]